MHRVSLRALRGAVSAVTSQHNLGVTAQFVCNSTIWVYQRNLCSVVVTFSVVPLRDHVMAVQGVVGMQSVRRGKLLGDPFGSDMV